MEAALYVLEYIACIPGLLDALRFLAMKDAGAVEELVERNEFKPLTAAGGWKKWWNNWGSCGCLTMEVTHDNLEIPYIRCERRRRLRQATWLVYRRDGRK